MADLATLEQFEARYGDVPAEEHATVEEWLQDAEALILSLAEGSVREWVLSPGTAAIPRAVTAVCASVAYRAWSNPDVLSNVSVGGVGVGWQSPDDPAALYLTDQEQRLLRRASGGSGMVRSVTLESPYSGPVTGEDILA